MQKTCAACGASFEAKRASARSCSERCKKRLQRRPGGTATKVVELKTDPVPGPTAGQGGPEGPVSAATRTELASAGRLESPGGQAALMLARRIDQPHMETGSGLAALVREHRATLADAVKDAEKAADPLDELRLRRERRLAGG